MHKKQILSDFDVIWSLRKSWRQNKNLAGHVLNYDSKKFHWLNKKQLRMAYDWIEITI